MSRLYPSSPARQPARDYREEAKLWRARFEELLEKHEASVTLLEGRLQDVVQQAQAAELRWQRGDGRQHKSAELKHLLDGERAARADAETALVVAQERLAQVDSEAREGQQRLEELGRVMRAADEKYVRSERECARLSRLLAEESQARKGSAAEVADLKEQLKAAQQQLRHLSSLLHVSQDETQQAAQLVEVERAGRIAAEAEVVRLREEALQLAKESAESRHWADTLVLEVQLVKRQKAAVDERSTLLQQYHDESLQALQEAAEHRAASEAAQQQARVQLDGLTAELTACKRRAESAEQVASSTRATAAVNEQALRAEVATLQSRLQERADEVRRLERQLEDQSYAAQAADARVTQMESRLRVAAEQHDEALSEQRRLHRATVEQLRQKAEQDAADALTAQAKALQAKADGQRADAVAAALAIESKNAAERLSAAVAVARQEAAQEAAAKLAERERGFEATISAANEHVAKAQRETQERIAELQGAHAAALASATADAAAAARLEAEARFDALLQEAAAAHQRAVVSVQEAADAACEARLHMLREELQEAYMADTGQLRDEHATELRAATEELEAAHALRIHDLQLEHQSDLTALQISHRSVLEEWQSRARSLESGLDMLRSELLQVQAHCSMATQSEEHTQAAAAAIRTEAAALKAELDSAKSSYASLEQRMASQQHELAEARMATQRLQASVSAKELQLHELQMAHATATKQLAQYVKVQDATSVEVQTLQVQLEEQRAQCTRLADLLAAQEALNKRLLSTQEAKEAEHALHCARIQAEADVAHQRLSDANERHMIAVADEVARRCTDAVSACDASWLQRSTAMQEQWATARQDYEERVRSLEASLHRATAEQRELAAHSSSKTAEAAQLQQMEQLRVQQIEQQRQQLQAELAQQQASKDAVIRSLRGDVEAARKSAEEKLAACDQLRQELRAAQAQVAAAAEEHARLQRNIDELRLELSAKSAGAFEQVEAARQELRLELDRVRQQHSAEIVKVSAEASTSSQDLGKQQQQMQRLQAELSDAQTKLAAAEHSLADTQQRLAAQVQQEEQVRQRAAEEAKAHAEQQQQMSVMHSEHSEQLARRVQQLEEDNKELQAALDRVTGECAAAEEHRAAVTASMHAALQQKDAEWHAVVQALQAAIAELEQRAAALQQRLEDTEAKLAAAQSAAAGQQRVSPGRTMSPAALAASQRNKHAPWVPSVNPQAHHHIADPQNPVLQRIVGVSEGSVAHAAPASASGSASGYDGVRTPPRRRSSTVDSSNSAGVTTSVAAAVPPHAPETRLFASSPRTAQAYAAADNAVSRARQLLQAGGTGPVVAAPVLPELPSPAATTPGDALLTSPLVSPLMETPLHVHASGMTVTPNNISYLSTPGTPILGTSGVRYPAASPAAGGAGGPRAATSSPVAVTPLNSTAVLQAVLTHKGRSGKSPPASAPGASPPVIPAAVPAAAVSTTEKTLEQLAIDNPLSPPPVAPPQNAQEVLLDACALVFGDAAEAITAAAASGGSGDALLEVQRALDTAADALSQAHTALQLSPAAYSISVASAQAALLTLAAAVARASAAGVLPEAVLSADLAAGFPALDVVRGGAEAASKVLQAFAAVSP